MLRADIQDRDGGKIMLAEAKAGLPRMKRLWADGAYTGSFVEWVGQQLHWTVEEDMLTGAPRHDGPGEPAPPTPESSGGWKQVIDTAPND